MSQERQNQRVMIALLGLVLAMGGLAYASVPLYQLFCQLTGYGGTTQRVELSVDLEPINHFVEVQFDASVNGGLLWEFTPPAPQEQVQLGLPALVSYRARSLASEDTHGTALFNVTPAKAGLYFNKIQCFCFTQQTLAAGQITDFPVAFYIDPAMITDPDLAHVDTITLSYTFYEAASDALDQAAGAVWP